MKSLVLKITPLLFGLFIVGLSFGSFAGVAQAGWTGGQCVSVTYPNTCYSNSGYYSGSYACASWFGCAGGCGTNNVWYGCGAYNCSYTNSCAYTTPIVCTPDSTSASISCSDPAAAPYVGNRTVGTAYYTYDSCSGTILSTNTSGCTAPCTTLSDTRSCSDPAVATYVNGRTVGTLSFTYNSCTFAVLSTNTSNCTAPIPVPSNPSISASPNPVQTTQSFHAEWGATNATSYTVTLAGVSYPFGSDRAWDGTPSSLGLGAGSYPLSVQACSSTGCVTSPSNYSLVVNLPTPPSTPTVSVTPNPVVLNQDIAVSWTTSTGATRYEYKTDVSATPVSMDGFTNPWRGSSAGFVIGDHKIFVRGCNSSTNCGGWGSGDFTVISASAPVITSFTSSPTGFSAGGGNVTLSWTTVNADSCTLTSDGGLNLTGDPRSIRSYPIPDRVTRTTTYTLTCSGPGGTTTQ